MKQKIVQSVPPRRRIIGGLLTVFILFVVFELGVSVGNGRLSLPSSGYNSLNGSLPAQLDYSSVNKVYGSLKDNYDGKLTETQLIDGLKKGLAEATDDPYTEYFTAAEAQDFSNQLNNSFSGIGAELGKDADGNLQIIAPIDGFPAAKAGLQSKDLVTSIDGSSTSGISVDEAVSKIRGPKGSSVKLGIVRGDTPLQFVITRDTIHLKSVTTKTLDGDIGYMQISTFAADTSDLADKAAAQFKQVGVKGIVLDLRDNPGGLLTAADDVSSLWLNKGSMILQEKRGSVVVDTHTASGNDILHGIPTVVLIDGGSASASEITAGALHDNKAAKLIGVKSYGKGVVQQVICVTGPTKSDGSCTADELKVTVASWFRPNGQNINHRGITPDQIIKLTDDDVKAGRDPQLDAATSYLRNL